jgi:hypothetical protein
MNVRQQPGIFQIAAMPGSDAGGGCLAVDSAGLTDPDQRSSAPRPRPSPYLL